MFPLNLTHIDISPGGGGALNPAAADIPSCGGISTDGAGAIHIPGGGDVAGNVPGAAHIPIRPEVALNGALALHAAPGLNPAVFEMLGAMGTSVVRCGEIGAGNTTKLANQIIVACNIQALAEALTLAQKAGVDPQLVFQAIRGGLAGSTVMDAKAPMMIGGNDTPGFKIDLHIKDLNNALDCAHTVGSPVPMTASVQEIMQWLHNHEGGQKDHSAIAQYYEYLTGIRIGR